MTEKLDIEFLSERYSYEKRGPDPLAVTGGVMGVLATAALLVSLPLIASADVFEERKSPYDQAPFEYVEARLLKWGAPKEEKALPDRVVPALPTAPEEVLPLDREEERPPPKVEPKKKPRRQRSAVTDDKLREVFDRARAFAEIQDDYVPEGHPDGVPGGDVTDPSLASIGDTYAYRVRRIFYDRWVVPTLVSEAELKGLTAKVTIKVDIDMTIVSVRFARRSGNDLFDDSVKNAIEQVRLEVRSLPEPPEVIASRIFGGGFSFTFSGKDAPNE